MSGGGGGRKAAGPIGEEAEVEALLRAAQDAVMLKLQANSHLVSSSASAPAPAPGLPPTLDAAAADPLEDDLARRFDALKSRAAAPSPKPKPAGAAAGAGAAAPGGMDELEARFAALKGAAGPEKEARVRLEDLGAESEDEEDEVDKVMRWAVDAARLDVATAGAGGGDKAKPAEEEEEKDEKSSVSSEDDDDDDERLELEMAKKRKEMAKSKSKSKWFFL